MWLPRNPPPWFRRLFVEAYRKLDLERAKRLALEARGRRELISRRFAAAIEAESRKDVHAVMVDFAAMCVVWRNAARGDYGPMDFAEEVEAAVAKVQVSRSQVRDARADRGQKRGG